MSIRDASILDAYELLSRPIRKEDTEEWVAGGGLPPHMALPEAFKDDRSKVLRAVIWDNEVVAIYGLTVAPDGSFLWLVGADRTLPLGMGFLALWRDRMAELHAAGGNHLYAVADNRNPRHHVWLNAMGFVAVTKEWRGGFDPSVSFTIYSRTRED